MHQLVPLVQCHFRRVPDNGSLLHTYVGSCMHCCINMLWSCCFSAALTHNAESSHCSACVALFGVAHAYPPWLTSVFVTLLVEMGNPRQWHFCMPKGLQVVLSKTMSTSRMSVCVCVCVCVSVRACVSVHSVCLCVCSSVCLYACARAYPHTMYFGSHPSLAANQAQCWQHGKWHDQEDFLPFVYRPRLYRYLFYPPPLKHAYICSIILAPNSFTLSPVTSTVTILHPSLSVWFALLPMHACNSLPSPLPSLPPSLPTSSAHPLLATYTNAFFV